MGRVSTETRPSLSKKLRSMADVWIRAGEREEAAARLAWDQMPRNTLPHKACGEQSEDFCAAARRKSNGIFKGCDCVRWRSSPAGSEVQPP